MSSVVARTLRMRFIGTAASSLMLAYAWGSATPASAASDNGPASSESAVDAATRPGDDFFAYANGAWLETTQIPPGKGKWGAGHEITERTRQQVAALLDDARTAPAGSDARKVADFRAAWLNQRAIEARGLASLAPLLARIDGIGDKASLTRFLGSTLAADVDPLNLGIYDSAHVLGLAVQEGNHGEPAAVAYLLQGGLGLPERDSYLSADPRQQAQRVQYEATLVTWLAELDKRGKRRVAQTRSRAAAVMALEIALARSHATREQSADEHNADTRWTRADFAREAPGLDWNAFFAAAGLANQPAFVAWQPGAVRGVAALVAQQPLQVWKDYLRIRAIAAVAEVLPRAYAAPALTLRGVPAGQHDSARAQRAVEATQAALGDAIGRLYVARHFPPEAKAKVQFITRNVITAFAARLDAVTWMAPATKATARAKLDRLYFGVGYPERWQDDSDLAIDPADPVGNQHRVAQRNYRRAIAQLGRPVDRTAWWITPQWPGAMLVFQLNAYNFAAALLQPPKFDAAASDAANYGAIGAIVGHEVSHFVDTLGADYDPDGRQRRWWTDDDIARYRAVTDALVQQVSACRPSPQVIVDGKASLTENLADLGGLVAAFDAYRASLGDKARDAATVRQQDRQFFIGFARAWRARYRDDALAAQAASDHAPESCRVALVRNLDAWHDAFDVKAEERLYLAPAARVRIW